jgi:hypothetical protein
MSLVVDRDLVEFDRAHANTNDANVALGLCGCALNEHKRTLAAAMRQTASKYEQFVAVWTHNPFHHFAIPRLKKIQPYRFTWPCPGRH